MNHSPTYYIQFRFIYATKGKIRQLIYDLTGRFGLKHEREVPHVTLAGPFHTSDENRLIVTFNDVCSVFPLMHFRINGFGFFDEKRVVFLKVEPDRSLKNFRRQLFRSLRTFSRFSKYDHEEDYAFHATIKKNLPQDVFDDIKLFLKNKDICFNHLMIRCTLLKNGFILREYDFLLRRLLNRQMALDNDLLQITMHKLKNQLK